METINNTPARNTNLNTTTAAYIEKATKDLENLFTQVAKHEEENPGKTFGYAGLPGVLNIMRTKGIDKIFFVGRDYHGKYEDDYCYFTYWDEDSKEFISDEWGTWAAFPSYDLYEMPISFSAGWESGMIDKEAYLDVMKKRHLDILSKTNFDGNVAKYYKLRVKVSGGRKWKGEGYLLDTEKSSYRFATPMYRNHADDYGISTTETALIWNPIDNTINRANFRYVEYLDAEKIMSAYTEWATKVINNATIYNIHSNNQYNLGSFILDVDYSFQKFMDDIWFPNHNIGDVLSTAYDPEEEARKKKESEFRASKMPELIEWVKNNTDKKDEEILELAIHIYNKRYNG